MLKKIKHPMLFQGNLDKSHYFEGWYYKQTSRDERSAVSFIPGVSLFPNNYHSFVQYIFSFADKNNNEVVKTGYVKYPLRAFEYEDNPFKIKVGKNIFSESSISINLSDEKMNIHGELELGKFEDISSTVLMPNIMGIFAYLPKLECYHEVISMSHKLKGTLEIDNFKMDFNDGKGYIEKDFGTSFPEKYVWIQSNNFKNESVSLTFSLGSIPFLKKSFLGYICDLQVDGKEYRFATYTKSKLKVKKINSSKVNLVLECSKSILELEADLINAEELKAPQRGKMKKSIKEELGGRVKIYLQDKENKKTYEDTSTMAGIEIVGFYE